MDWSVPVILQKEYFGEIALIETVPRTAAAVALEETTLRIIGVKSIVPYFKKNPDAMEKVLNNVILHVTIG